MGQPIKVSTTVLGDVMLVDTDRSITGQEGTAYTSADGAAADGRLPGRLAGRLYEADDSIAGVFVASNQVVIRRTDGWDEAAAETVSGIVEGFFVFYR
jgi:hypothetical protein